MGLYIYEQSSQLSPFFIWYFCTFVFMILIILIAILIILQSRLFYITFFITMSNLNTHKYFFSLVFSVGHWFFSRNFHPPRFVLIFYFTQWKLQTWFFRRRFNYTVRICATGYFAHFWSLHFFPFWRHRHVHWVWFRVEL